MIVCVVSWEFETNLTLSLVVFGTMTLELGDTSSVRCISSDLICELEFKTKVQ